MLWLYERVKTRESFRPLSSGVYAHPRTRTGARAQPRTRWYTDNNNTRECLLVEVMALQQSSEVIVDINFRYVTVRSCVSPLLLLPCREVPPAPSLSAHTHTDTHRHTHTHTLTLRSPPWERFRTSWPRWFQVIYEKVVSFPGCFLLFSVFSVKASRNVCETVVFKKKKKRKHWLNMDDWVSVRRAVLMMSHRKHSFLLLVWNRLKARATHKMKICVYCCAV